MIRTCVLVKVGNYIHTGTGKNFRDALEDLLFGSLKVTHIPPEVTVKVSSPNGPIPAWENTRYRNIMKDYLSEKGEKK